MAILMDFISKDNLPKSTELSPDIKERSEGYIRIRLHGTLFYVPVTKELKKLFKISRRGNKFEIAPPYKKEKQIEDFLQDFIQTMYLQVREEVGSEIHAILSQELKEGFNNLFSNYLDKRIEQGFEQKQIGFNKKE